MEDERARALFLEDRRSLSAVEGGQVERAGLQEPWGLWDSPRQEVAVAS